MASTKNHETRALQPPPEESENEFEEGGGGGSEEWEDWMDNEEEEGDSSFDDLVCLFCDARHASCDVLFEHCRGCHHFDFYAIRNALSLDFYGSLKLINYVRSEVKGIRCWSCSHVCLDNQDLLNHLHEAGNLNNIKLCLEDDKYLKPFLLDDALLYSFGECEGGEDDSNTIGYKEELMSHMKIFEEIRIDVENTGKELTTSSGSLDDNGNAEVAFASNGHLDMACSSKSDGDMKECAGLSDSKDMLPRGSLVNLAEKDIKNVNENYFGAYSSFGIHREMISDKVRMDAYGQAILKNPSLLNGAVVMDLGCGTGILSLFAAQAGASRVIAVEASEKMAAVATQIAKDNGFWRSQSTDSNQSTGVLEVVHSMAEDLHKSIQIQPNSIDVLVSEWMGYCLLYESMLNSVLFARDRWLKPGGAILPDTATMFVVGFGRGGTSLPFWENVYSFNMSCIGKELVQDAAKIPIVDVVDDRDLVTDAVVLQTFDLTTMKPDEVDFTTSIELEPKMTSPASDSSQLQSDTTWCYGVVLWFETGFTSRFCKEMPAVLSTSPYTPKTHWSQTVLTFHEPIAIALEKPSADKFSKVGIADCPAAKIHLRISIARAVQYRSIDISLETTAVGSSGRKFTWPAQIFNLS
ncbi:arginine N-methyltransferase family protein [Tripterygium wilfordii]|uniref:Arginine N-methyltransferase family protein n=1 Tax=Tripterygium wilfordii TaxID=458696 RepID=A0A7J7CHZ7_TRIWF|nr:probable protein arginine N-methyltransferase 3 [Tripterygium wilfordii]KAF5733646.1 arginine N-methyltransferase family protein [Tripterygium wilfordii]